MKTTQATADQIGEQLSWLIRNNDLNDDVISEGCELMDAVITAPIATERDLLSVLAIARGLLDCAPDIATQHDPKNGNAVLVGVCCLESAVAYLETKTGTARESFTGDVERAN